MEHDEPDEAVLPLGLVVGDFKEDGGQHFAEQVEEHIRGLADNWVKFLPGGGKECVDLFRRHGCDGDGGGGDSFLFLVDHA